MNRALNNATTHDNYDVAQFWRGAVTYARQHWWVALWLAYIAAHSIYKWEVRADARLLLSNSIVAFIFMFWWVFHPTLRGGLAPEDFGILIGISFTAFTIKDNLDWQFLILFTAFCMAWPWIRPVKAPWIIKWLVGGTAFFIMVFLIKLFTVG